VWLHLQAVPEVVLAGVSRMPGLVRHPGRGGTPRGAAHVPEWTRSAAPQGSAGLEAAGQC
jgi:hypothetical protein